MKRQRMPKEWTGVVPGHGRVDIVMWSPERERKEIKAYQACKCERERHKIEGVFFVQYWPGMAKHCHELCKANGLPASNPAVHIGEAVVLALRNYNFERGVLFMTYARQKLLGVISTAIARNEFDDADTVRIPIVTRRKMFAAREVGGDEENTEVVADAIAAQEAMENAVYLDDLHDGEQSAQVADPRLPSPEEAHTIAHAPYRRLLARALDNLTRRQQAIIWHRFCSDPEKSPSYEATARYLAEHLGEKKVHRERIRQLCDLAKEALKMQLVEQIGENDIYSDYLPDPT